MTHTALIDGATTFDSPFPANDGRLGLGISLLPACGQGRALLMAFQGLPYPVLQTGFALPSSPVIDGGFFVRVKLPPAAYAPGFGQIAAHGGDLSARRRVPVPHALTLEDCRPLQRPNLTSRRRGRRAPKGADGAHGAASGARTAKGREADRRDSGDGRARAPRATDFGQRPKDAGGCAPAPAKISARV